jgi:hypothetical protein
VNTSFSKSKHTCLCANSLSLGTTSASHAFSNLSEVNAAHEVHFARVNLQDVKSTVLVGVGDLNFSIDTARTEQSIVKNINSVSGHNNFDVIC